MRLEFVERFCLPRLLDARNDDGGWGFKIGSRSRAEPTAWALLSLLNSAARAREETASRAARFLSAMQLPDGSWPASPDLPEGSWATSLVCLALHRQNKFPENVTRGLNWLCNDLPGDSNLFRRLVRRLTVKNTVAKQDDSLYGWSWTPGTSSWVEPTAYALIFLHRLPAAALPETARHRQRRGAAMLLDRMCPGGGWNCGNPMVYGVPGEPQVGPTVWALLALKDRADAPQVQESLNWLERSSRSVGGPGLSPASLALTQIAMTAYGRSDITLTDLLLNVYERTGVSWSVPELAWAALALGDSGEWLAPASPGNA